MESKLEAFSAYHPRKTGGGVALKVEAVPGRYKADRWKAAGLFLQLAEQAGPLRAGQGAPFAWGKSLRFMLATRDLLALRYAYAAVQTDRPLPRELLPPKVQDGWTTCSLVHRSASLTSVLHWAFDLSAGTQYLRLLVGERKLAIQLSEFEGYQFDQWLSAAYPWMLQWVEPWQQAEDAR